VTRRAVFLDRDGVVNRAVVRNGRPHPPASADDLEVLPGVPGALEKLKRAGFETIVVTNQPDIARGTTTSSAVDAINERLQAALRIDAVFVCPHDESDRCRCRKPLPGLLEMAAEARTIDLRSSYLVGDRWRDIDAGRAAGCTTFFVDYRYDERRPDAPDYVVASLAEAAEIIIGIERRNV
jgi:D-glycero-D-manno-heptose 1,7-bisphosphate phosphatase